MYPRSLIDYSSGAYGSQSGVTGQLGMSMLVQNGEINSTCNW